MSDAVSYRICSLDELTDESVRQFTVADHEVAVVRLGDEVFALADHCSHQDVALSDGEVDADMNALECPKHGGSFCLSTGQPLSLPPTQPVAVYEVRIEAGEVSVVIA